MLEQLNTFEYAFYTVKNRKPTDDPYVAAKAWASRITNVAALAPGLIAFATLAGQIPVTAVTQSRPYPGTPTKTFEAGMMEIAY